MTKQEILAQIHAIEAKLNETVSSVDRGPVKDALKIVIPMMNDQLDVLKNMLDMMTK